MLDNKVKFDDKYIDNEYETITLYFIADKEAFGYLAEKDFCKYSESDSIKISIEFPMNGIEASNGLVCISTLDKFEQPYEWQDINLSYEVVEELIKLANI